MGSNEKIVSAHRTDIPGMLGECPETFSLLYANIGDLLIERAALAPEKAILTFFDDDLKTRADYTAAQLLSRVRKAANLIADRGVSPGETISTIDEFNHADTLVLLYAAWLSGLRVAPINLKESDERVLYVLEHSESRAAFIRDEALDRMQPILARAKISRIVSMSAFDEEIAKRSDRFEPLRFGIDQEALLVYTSGTTGPPKGVLLTQEMLFDCDGIAHWHGFTDRDVFMTAMPLFHVNAIVTSALTSLYVGGRLVLNRKWKPALFWRRVAEEKVTATSVVPAMLKSLSTVGEPIDRLYPRLKEHFKTLICGAGQLYIDVAEEFSGKFGIKIRHGWGMSETTCYSCFLPRDLTDEEYRRWISAYGFPSIGVPIRHNKMAIIDPGGRFLGPSERGEIVVAGRTIMKGYFKNLEANEKTFNFGVLQTGDEGFYRLDDRGRPFFFITSRIKELIERGGEKYSTFEIDQALRGMHGVEHALAFGFSNRKMGEEIGAVVQLKAGADLTEEEMFRYFQRLGWPWEKTPKVLRVVKEIPQTATGKDQRLKFASLFDGYYTKEFRR